MIAGIICGAIAGVISAAVVAKKMCLNLIKKLEEIEAQHRKELFEVSTQKLQRILADDVNTKVEITYQEEEKRQDEVFDK